MKFQTKKNYDFIKKSVYGGRCNAIKKEYKSSAKFDNYEEFINSNDFIFNADVSSLYPTAMAGFEHIHIKYPIGKSRWSNKPEEEFKNNKFVFYDIEYVPPTNINYPILPTRL